MLADLEGPGIAQEQVCRARLLAVGEGQHALFTQRIAAKAGQHVQQIVGVAHPVEVPGNLIVPVHVGRAVLVELVDQPLGGQALALHEIAIDLGQAALRQLAQFLVIVEQGDERRFLATDFLRAIGLQEGQRGVINPAPGQRFEDRSDLRGVFLVLHQQLEMPPGLGQIIAHFGATRQHQRQVICGEIHRGGLGGHHVHGPILRITYRNVNTPLVVPTGRGSD